MILEEFNAWCKKKRKGKDRKQFQKYVVSEDFYYNFYDIAWQIYNMQVVLEGLITDMGDMHLSFETPRPIKGKL